MDPYPRQRDAARTAEPGKHARPRVPARSPAPDGRPQQRASATHIVIRQASPKPAGGGEKEDGRCRAGDEEEDHRLVQALQPPPPGGGPGTAVIQRARPEQGAKACRIDSGGRDLRSSVRAGQQQRATRQRRPETEQVQPAAKNRPGVVDIAAGIDAGRPAPGEPVTVIACPDRWRGLRRDVCGRGALPVRSSESSPSASGARRARSGHAENLPPARTAKSAPCFTEQPPGSGAAPLAYAPPFRANSTPGITLVRIRRWLRAGADPPAVRAGGCQGRRRSAGRGRRPRRGRRRRPGRGSGWRAGRGRTRAVAPWSRCRAAAARRAM